MFNSLESPIKEIKLMISPEFGKEEKAPVTVRKDMPESELLPHIKTSILAASKSA